MAIQHRHGEFKDFDPNKMVTAELAVVTSGDPASPTGRTLYICFAPGIVKRIVSYEDFENELQNATEEIQQAFTKEIRTAISNSIAATNAANEAKEAADLAAEAARKAAEAAGAYVLGDISGKTVKFSEAETRENINTGESTATMFGKIKKWFADLKNIAFTGNYSDLLNVPEIVNNRATTKEGTVLDGRQGKAIQDEFDKLNTKIGSYKVLYDSPTLMTDVQTAPLSEKISSQKNGIALVFSVFENESTKNKYKSCFFIHKSHIALVGESVGCTFSTTVPQTGKVMHKCLFLYDSKITGSASNVNKYDNSSFVLERVIGF